MKLTHPEFLALLRGVVDNPADAAPLVDWLTENGYDQLAALVEAWPAIWPVVSSVFHDAVHNTPVAMHVTSQAVMDLHAGEPVSERWWEGPE